MALRIASFSAICLASSFLFSGSFSFSKAYFKALISFSRLRISSLSGYLGLFFKCSANFASYSAINLSRAALFLGSFSFSL